jgi:hypothetical protein
MIGLVFCWAYAISSVQIAGPYLAARRLRSLAQVALGIGVLTEGRFNYFRKFWNSAQTHL